ncbi:MAG: heat-inducible transcription repressor HrcA [Bacilli bacterium]|nr:heat-inducible transcription repressor HrcA [Bacilli bacterium]
MLTNRQEQILKIIVDKYIKNPVPVGSKMLSKMLNCSSATIRNDMVELENKKLIEKTHTSSGRVPSEAGYRYYVDNLMEEKKMDSEDMMKLQIVLQNKQLALSDVISKSLQVISDMTNYTTIALGAKSHDNLLKQIEVVPIDNSSLIVLIVTDRGYVEHKNIKLENVDTSDIKKTVNLINTLIVGTPIDEVNKKLEFEIKPIIAKYVVQHEKLYNAFYSVFNDFNKEEVNIVGREKILEQPEFTTNVKRIKEVYNRLDSPDFLQKIEEDEDNNIKVYIGDETGIEDDVTVIKSTFKKGNEEGTIAIIGPKRMDYDRVLSMLEYMKENIEND